MKSLQLGPHTVIHPLPVQAACHTVTSLAPQTDLGSDYRDKQAIENLVEAHVFAHPSESMCKALKPSNQCPDCHSLLGKSFQHLSNVKLIGHAELSKLILGQVSQHLLVNSRPLEIFIILTQL